MPLGEIGFVRPTPVTGLGVPPTSHALPTLIHPTQVKYIRATSLKTFEYCPHSWAYRYLLPEGTQDEESRTGAAAIGTAIHTICEDFMMKLHGGKEMLITDEVAQAWGIVPNEEIPNVEKYLQTLADMPITNVIAIEERLYHKMRDDAPPLSGQMDIVAEQEGNILLIIDHKSNRSYNGRDFWQSQLQQLVYGWMARKEWPGFDKYKFRIGYPNLGTFVEWETDPDDDEHLRLRFDKMWSAMIAYSSEGSWPMHINDECNWCPVKARCTEYHTSVSEFASSFQTKMASQPVTEQLIYIKNISKIVEQVKAELEMQVAKQVIDAGGSLNVAGKTWTYETGQRRVATFQDTMRELQLFTSSHPETLDVISAALPDLFSVSVTALDRLKVQVPDLDAMIEKVAVKTDNSKPTLKSVEARKVKAINAR